MGLLQKAKSCSGKYLPSGGGTWLDKLEREERSRYDELVALLKLWKSGKDADLMAQFPNRTTLCEFISDEFDVSANHAYKTIGTRRDIGW